MKRQKFAVTSTEGHSVIKYRFNSAIRETERLIRETARNENATYELTDKSATKEGFFYVCGWRQWTRADGKVVLFHITELP